MANAGSEVGPFARRYRARWRKCLAHQKMTIRWQRRKMRRAAVADPSRWATKPLPPAATAGVSSRKECHPPIAAGQRGTVGWMGDLIVRRLVIRGEFRTMTTLHRFGPAARPRQKPFAGIASLFRPSTSVLMVACLAIVPARAWDHWGGDAGGTRFSPLTQITPANVDNLVRAWEFHTGDLQNRPPRAKTALSFVRPLTR
jgi:hypothetical protein